VSKLKKYRRRKIIIFLLRWLEGKFKRLAFVIKILLEMVKDFFWNEAKNIKKIFFLKGRWNQ